MPRPPKHPEHKEQAEKLMNTLLNNLVQLWASEKEPQLQSIAEELEMSAAKVRKLLITAGVRDGKTYYASHWCRGLLRKDYKVFTRSWFLWPMIDRSFGLW